MKTAIYAGSFDPPTNGHLWMIRAGASLFDRLIVAIGVNPDKRYTYPLEQRLEMLRMSVADIANVSVDTFTNRFLADYARTCSARYVLRGIRSESDYEYERGMRYLNEEMNEDLTTVFLIPPRSLVEVSSSMIKGLRGSIGWESVVRKYVPPAVFSTIVRDELARRFRRLWESLGGGSGQTVFEDIAARYSQPHRHYHTLAHVCACLSELDALDLEPANHLAIELAIWFHDVIYEVPGRDNETRSAEYFQSAIRESGANAPVAEVVAMILATQRHEISGEAGASLPLFLDIDLSILGASRERFAEYDAGIRREYSSIADTVYCPERRRVLQRFLDRPALYFTSAFRERYEAQARDNLQQAVRMLTLPE